MGDSVGVQHRRERRHAGAEGLSGLAKAFFYARALLVSHWSVSSEATVAITTTMPKEGEKQLAPKYKNR